MSLLDVKTITDAEKYNNLQLDHSMIVMFYRDGCGHCEEFKPIYTDKFLKEMSVRHPNTKVVMINVTKEGYEHINGFGSNENDILGVPTIMYFTREQANKFEYDPPGKRTHESLMEFVDKYEKIQNAQSGGAKPKRVKHRHKKTQRRRNVKRKTNRKTKRKTKRKLRKNSRKKH